MIHVELVFVRMFVVVGVNTKMKTREYHTVEWWIKMKKRTCKRCGAGLPWYKFMDKLCSKCELIRYNLSQKFGTNEE
jgi:hypothetical protein